MAREFLAELAEGGQGVVLDGDRADGHRREDGDDVLGAVRHDEADAIALGHPGADEDRRGALHPLDELGVGDGAREEVEGDAFGVAGGDLFDHAGQGRVRDVDRVGDAGCVSAAEVVGERHCGIPFPFPTLP